MWLYRLARFVCMIYFSIAYRLHFEGMENIPAKGPYIVACNHRSNADPILLAHKVPQQIHFMGKAELFSTPFLKWIFTTIGGFPVNRGAGDTSAIDRSVELIESGKLLGLFPEGTRNKEDWRPQRFKSGTALIAQRTHADVLPCCVYYEGRLRWGTHVTVRFGPLIPYEQLGFSGSDSPREYKAATKVIYDAVLTLMGREEDAD